MSNDTKMPEDNLQDAIAYYQDKLESSQAMMDTYKNAGVVDDAWQILRWVRIHRENEQLLAWLTELQSYRNKENVDEN